MSDDMLGRAVRQLVALPTNTLGTVYDLLVKAADPENLRIIRQALRKEQRSGHLHLLGGVIIPTTGSPGKGLQQREGLWMSRNFKEFVLPHISHIKTVEDLSEVALSVWKLAMPANDVEIMDATGEPVDATVFGYVLDYLLSEQPNGEDGFLLTNRNWIIIHVRVGGEVFAVNFGWSDVHQEWLVNTHRLHDLRWHKGSHVMSLATA